MKTIGLLGGMSWQSTLGYYQQINELVALKLGGLHSAKIAMRSVDFAPVAAMQKQDRWQEMGQLLSAEARLIEAAGADCLLICTNTMHLVAEQVAEAISIPLLHIADATAQQLHAQQQQKVALLGTVFTMQKSFYKDRIRERFGIEVIVPDNAAQLQVNDVIYNELCVGQISETSRQQFLNIIAELKQRGAEGVILGCTEIGLLVQQQHCSLPLFDTTSIHAKAAVDFALA
ncbi:aspartate/glutamate racemase family protein [Planctobacterium marinum]|uniref:aspartate/glutamate racemase family protein n=1 Tax=Planctobacterium marinum TaxID=1631968 RepID=UPI001E30FA38|nr:aspartate/glutamate racemase family protein [Planctobacterium marinum]MCC2605257.1 aspartate/glutamate racemase family protein [Planctobacterium marinum]